MRARRRSADPDVHREEGHEDGQRDSLGPRRPWQDSLAVRLTRAERREQTRADLLTAAERVFVERGFEGASIEAIADEAGYTRGAFYSNFSTKAELFAELLQERVYQTYRGMAAASAAGERQSLRETGERLAAIQGAGKGRWLFRLWLELLAHAGRDPQFRKLAARFWSTTRDLSAEGIRRAYDEAGHRAGTAALRRSEGGAAR